MYSKQQASAVRQAFYTAFGTYMAPVLSADGEPQNWINYKTGVKHIFIRMDTPNRGANVGIQLTDPDPLVRLQVFQQFQQLKNILVETTGYDDWIWEPSTHNQTGQEISRIYVTLERASVLNKADWPELISFFKARLIALDQFWRLVKFQFEA
jgi:hypothetical protein